MRSFIKNIIPFIAFTVLFLLPKNLEASHIIGGDIYYDYQGGSSYKIYISAFRDCLSNGAEFDSPLTLGVFRRNGNSRVGTYNVPYTGKVRVPVQFNNPCVIPPSNICVENSIYTITLNLPPIPGGYVVSYTRCCRGPQINNLMNPDDQGLTLTVNIPGTEDNHYQNSSPRFTGYPPLLLCNNDDLVFNHGATDPDGDQLVYSLATPYQGGTSFNPAPNPPLAPPYQQVTWGPSYTPNTPLGPGSSLTIDPATGVLTADPNLAGRYVVGIRVSEYRNGTLISSMVRDFIFQVFNCQITMQAIVPPQEQMQNFNGFCNGEQTVQFTNNSYGGTNYAWNFNDPGSGTNNTSSLFAPSHTFSDTGTYRVRLIVNPGWPCTDTAFVTISIYNDINLTHNIPAQQCLTDNSFQFTANANTPATTVYDWQFGATATPTQASGSAVSTSFSTPGTKNIQVKGKYKVCESIKNFTVEVLPSPTARFNVSSNYKCEGRTVSFANTSQNAPVSVWDFGDGTVVSDPNPTHTYAQPGTYQVKLITSNGTTCVDSFTMPLIINEEIRVSLPAQNNQCILDNSYDFVGAVSGPIGTNYSIQLTDIAQTLFTGTELRNFTFQSIGPKSVTLSGVFEGCRKDTTIRFQIISVPYIDFELVKDLACVPYMASIRNLSKGDTELFYEWDFGNGDRSNDTHPSTLYDTEGTYTITLRLWANEGCTDTLTIRKEDLVWVHPKPTADFTADKFTVDICESNVQFTNLAQGDLFIQYDFDDKGARSNEINPLYIFNNEGDHKVVQYIMSKHQCKDTAELDIYVRPFTVFIPNTFSPNDDEWNNYFGTVVQMEPVDWHLQIYNRWGEMIYESFDANSKWDGNYNGKPAPEGMYNYKINYSPCHLKNKDRKTIVGHVNLLR